MAKAVHEVKGPLLAIWARGWELAGETSDTALAAYLAMPGQRSFDLGDLAVRYLRRELKDAAAEEAQLTLDGLGPSEEDVAAEAAQVDLLKSTAVKDLADALEPMLERAQRRPAAHRTGAAAHPGAGRHGGAGASRPTSTTCATCSASSPTASPPRPPSATRSSAGR